MSPRATDTVRGTRVSNLGPVSQSDIADIEWRRRTPSVGLVSEVAGIEEDRIEDTTDSRREVAGIEEDRIEDTTDTKSEVKTDQLSVFIRFVEVQLELGREVIYC